MALYYRPSSSVASNFKRWVEISIFLLMNIQNHPGEWRRGIIRKLCSAGVIFRGIFREGVFHWVIYWAGIFHKKFFERNFTKEFLWEGEHFQERKHSTLKSVTRAFDFWSNEPRPKFVRRKLTMGNLHRLQPLPQGLWVFFSNLEVQFYSLSTILNKMIVSKLNGMYTGKKVWGGLVALRSLLTLKRYIGTSIFNQMTPLQNLLQPPLQYEELFGENIMR